MSLIDKLGQSNERLGIAGQPLVVAVSGGADSLALFQALRQLRGEALPLLIAAHVNHQLRGPEADADEAFVRGLATGDGVRCEAVRIDVRALADAEGGNLEGTARRERYRWLERVATDNGVSLVATGHTADDQAETVLHRLMRGAGLQGLRGIARRRPLGTRVTLVRPLLDITRAEVLAFLQENGLTWREDSTNAGPTFTRNRIRHQLLPLLETQFNPAIRAILCRLSEEAGEAHDEEQAGALALQREAELARAGPVLVFELARLREATRRRVRLLFRLVWEREGWSTGEMGRREWGRLEAVVFDALTAVDLPGRIHVRRKEQVLQVTPAFAKSRGRSS
jgi:tRNA(Ile)-lysidine synthase